MNKEIRLFDFGTKNGIKEIKSKKIWYRKETRPAEKTGFISEVSFQMAKNFSKS